jgi:hypothetical protein
MATLAAMTERTIAVVPYVVAIAILVIGGALARTAILNWISGPVIVVACTQIIPPLLRRKGASK